MAKSPKRSLVSFEAWQVAEIQAGSTELDAGEIVSHEKVSEWLRSWGRPNEGKLLKRLIRPPMHADERR